jgi:hypothetical protein
MQFTFFHGSERRLAAALTLLLSYTVLLAAPSAMAQSGISKPGSASVNIYFPSSAQPAESDNLLVTGTIEQGVDFLSISDKTALNFFGRMDYRADTEELDFNRKILLGVGIKLRHYFSDAFVMSVGAKYENDKRFVVERSNDGTMLFGNWFGSWQVAGSSHDSGADPSPRSYPGLTWGEIRYPGSQDPFEEDTTVLEGYAEQGVEWIGGGRLGTFNLYVNLDYIADTEDIEWNNMVAVGVGARFKKLGRKSLLQYGIEATRERYWVTDEDLDVVFAYLNWSAWWNPRAARPYIPESSPHR